MVKRTFFSRTTYPRTISLGHFDRGHLIKGTFYRGPISKGHCKGHFARGHLLMIPMVHSSKIQWVAMVYLPIGKRSTNHFPQPRHSSKIKMKMILLCAALVRNRDAPIQLSLSRASSLTTVCDQWLYFSITDQFMPPMQISSPLMDICRSSLLYIHTFFACK